MMKEKITQPCFVAGGGLIRARDFCDLEKSMRSQTTEIDELGFSSGSAVFSAFDLDIKSVDRLPTERDCQR